MITRETLRRGLRNGMEIMRELAKVIIPMTVLLTILKQMGWLDALARFVAPVMSFLGLPGEGALVLVAGYFLGIYAAIAAILTLDLTAQQITILAVMLSICHALFLETAITKKIGVRVWPLALLRVVLSFVAGLGLNLLYQIAA